MGQAKNRGSFEERKARAIVEGRTKRRVAYKYNTSFMQRFATYWLRHAPIRPK